MNDATFAGYAAIVQSEFGIQLPPSKKTLLESRLYPVLAEGGPAEHYITAESFLRALRHDRSGHLLHILAEAITTHHTFFMREADHFRFYQKSVLPWVDRTAKDGDIRTWCAACSSGEESYTLAMILEDYFSLKRGVEKTMLATDLSDEILATARAGIYPRTSVASLPHSWQSTYFAPYDRKNLIVTDLLKRQVLYRHFNLMDPFPFRRPFHVIFCRNVMIYFDAPTRHELVQKFYDFLVPGGFLFLGHSEIIDRGSAPFTYVMPSVYRKPL